MSSHYKLPDPETIHHQGEQCGTAGEFVRDIVSESIRKVREVYEDAAMIGHACSERLNALDVETGPVIEQYAYTLREVTAARETQKSLDVLIRKLEQALKDERNRYAEIQEQIDSTDENEKKSALLNEQKNLLMDLQKKEGELKQARMKQAELLMAVIEKDREYMKALLRRNYLLGRKMTLTRAFNAFRERFEPVKKQMNDGVADEMNKKAAITAGELEKAQAVLISLSEKLRQMG